MINFIKVLLFFAVFVPITEAAPQHNNPWFSWRSLQQAESEFGIQANHVNVDQCVFSNKNSNLIFYNGRRRAEIDGITVWLNVAPQALPAKKEWQIATIDLDLIALSMRASATNSAKKLKIMLDPGHGGSDSGAVSACGQIKEKDINLAITLKTGKILKKAGFDVCYTRTNDRDCSLTERSRAASSQKAELFVSIHVNKAANTNACGVETFVLTPSGYAGTAAGSPPRGWQIGNKNDYHSNLLGYCIQKSAIGDSNIFDRGLKRQSFFVLRETYCPAALLEVGFISNPDDLKNLQCAQWRKECAERLAKGIIEYCQKVECLDHAVAKMRRERNEANQRWLARLESQKLDKVAINKPEEPAKERIASAQSTVIDEKTAASDYETTEKNFDPKIFTSQSFHSTVTNIYLTQDEKKPDKSDNTDSGLQSLIDFYESGELN